MDFLFSYVSVEQILLLGGLVLLLLAYQSMASRVRFRIPGSHLTLDDLAGRVLGSRYAEAKLNKAVSRYKKQGNYLAAGKLLEDAEKLSEAADAYLEGQEFWATAAVLERLGKGERAAELYLQAGDYKKAAEVLVTSGKPVKAAALFQEKGNNLEAARLYGLSGAWDRAGDLYSRSGYPLRAAEAYEKKGEFRKAAECYEKHFMENVSYSTTYSSTAPSSEKSALLAGRLYEKAGDIEKAVAIFSRGQYFKEAADLHVRLKQPARAAELYMRAEDPESAARAFESAGDYVRAANLRGEVALKSDRVAEAANFFVSGQDYLRAAELFESKGLLTEAAGAYEAGENFAAAGNVYVRAGNKGKAAASYERAGDIETAAKLYEEAGNVPKSMELFERVGQTFRSGEAAARAGDKQRAIALLQRVGPQDENYRAASELLARLFIQVRMPRLAVERLQKTVGGEPVAAANLNLYYWLAVAHDASGNLEEALTLYKKILAEDLSYRDVDKRVARLEGGGGADAESAAPEAAAPAMTPPADGGATPGPGAIPPSPTAAANALPTATAGALPTASTPAAAVPPSAPGATAAPPPAVPAAALSAPEGSAPAQTVAPAPAPHAPATAPRRPRFATREEVGRGRLGVVYRAEEEGDGRSVALRVLPEELVAADGVIAALAADLKAAAQLSHPNLVKVLGLVDMNGRRCVITEFVPGKSFAEALRAGRRMSFTQVHSLGRILAQVLSFVHARGLVHGSLQPSNVMVSSGVVKLADLGLSRLAPGAPGPESYRAPEGRLDAAGDVYALAAVLYHLLTGLHPKAQPQGSALPLPSRYASGVPETFDKLLLRCLHPRADLRFTTADEVLQELKDMVRIG